MRPLTSRAVCRARRVAVARPLARRPIHISATPASTTPSFDQDVAAASSTADARFEVLGAPYSLLSVSLSASQNLYTRRGTLVAVNGKAENTVSTLSLLEPFRRAALGIPFLYQRINSTSPISALISTKSPITSFAVVHLDGRLDWVVAQRQALLAWTGHSLSVRPKINTKMSLAHWGSSHVTGRGLLALAGRGQVYQVQLKAGEEYIVHPSNVLAYTMTSAPPQPYRFKSTSLRLQIPSFGLGALLPANTGLGRFIAEMRKSAAWKTLAQGSFTLRTWARRTVWGDRLFVRFQGPTTLLLQSRAARLSDSLTTRDVNEIADAPAGVVADALQAGARKESGHGSAVGEVAKDDGKSEEGHAATFASVDKDGKVSFERK
ncbi:uncharacterized protein K452DRAFT_217962 [Aplosporella prunicola CBS 121167]|uniref:Altered inheritance of mitochondria protein 24, mitochondrial n=1 Tax=Aplosporella prunicola CBS 121167 TaxID=1176127 RepID=A0A6A6BSQ8_9PEZI|nr:uncharacterized protein K452DRAFT_217962 [Aplosporella prunicola CBS 121167]KAF2147010.1 hypothetical protein K452DRAFT_217962 [Aplosporella prunicola CBS 121167]